MSIRVRVRGVGAIPVGEHWNQSISDLGVEAARIAMRDAEVERVDAIVVGNMLSGIFNRQENLGALIADRIGLSGVEAFKVEAACASGAAAARVGFSLVKSGANRRVLVLGVEKMTDTLPHQATEGLAYAADFEHETIQGATFPALGALLTSIYMSETGATGNDLFRFSEHAHHRAIHNPLAMFRHPISLQQWSRSQMIASPLRQLDCPPICDGAAAVILECSSEASNARRASIEIAAIKGVTDTLPITQRSDPLHFRAVEESVQAALDEAGVVRSQIDLFELHDAFPVVAAICLESAKFRGRGQGWKFFESSEETTPSIQSMGGLKGRGHPIGASGVYQIVEACLQLRGEALQCQISHVHCAMTQSLGGLGANAYTTILKRCGL